MSGGGTTPPGAGSGGTPAACATAPCPLPVSVVIKLSQPVACPGHPFEIDGVGSPSGGTYKWTTSGGTLVNAGGTPTSTGDKVFLRSFKADDSNGKIPEQSFTLGVEYTHPNGKATATQAVKVHKIDFDITDTTVTKGVTKANETAFASGVNLTYDSIATIATDPKVKIKLDSSCPRKADCAANHRAGWLQVVTSHERSIYYEKTLRKVLMTIPVRDAFAAGSIFYATGFVHTFTGDNDQETIHHEDSPGTGAAWSDPRTTAPVPPAGHLDLKSITFKEGFTSWLVVQNIEWSTHDVPGSLAYQKHFDWSLSITTTVDMTKTAGHRCSPSSSPPAVGAMADGKGTTPLITGPIANNAMSESLTAR